jgi:hypothetical protein
MNRTALVRRTAVLVGTLLCCAALPALAQPSAPVAQPVCAGARPTITHFPGGLPTGGLAGVACGGTTGYAGAESHLVATKSGAVVFTPAVLPEGLVGTDTAPVPVGNDTQSNASPAGQAITVDNGRTWQLIKPSGVTWNPTDHGDYVDPVTGRLFFADYGPIPLAPQFGPEQEGPAHINWSADDGKTWQHTAIDTVFLPENPRFTSAPPPVGQPKPVGYADVVYFCANSNVGFTSPVITSRRCWASLDGGTTFTEKGTILRGAPPVHPECGGAQEDYSAIDGSYPQPASDGSLFLMVSCGGATYLARSTDEAATFPILKRPDGAPLTLPLPTVEAGLNLGDSDLRVGPDDTLYLVDQEPVGARDTVVLRVSRDAGRTWSAPADLLAPGLSGVLHWAMDQRGDQLAVAYLSHRAGPTWDGWITTTSGAAGALAQGGRPVLTSGQVNDPKRPLLYADEVSGGGTFQLPGGIGNQVPFPPPFDIQVFGNDFIGATITPSGSAWGSYTQDCGPAPDAPGCVEQKGQTRGYAGHLERLTARPVGGPPAAAPPAARVRQLPATGGGLPLAALGLLVALLVIWRRAARA